MQNKHKLDIESIPTGLEMAMGIVLAIGCLVSILWASLTIVVWLLELYVKL